MPEERMKWRSPDRWTVTQSDGRQVRIKMKQDGNTLVGTAHDSSGDQLSEMVGAMSGAVEGDEINMTIYWPDGSVGEFAGSVSADGKARGTTVIRSDDASSADWSAEPGLLPWE